jgi:hypothetical protein
MSGGQRLLCYESKAPLLRVLNLESLEIEELPTPWDKGFAIDTAWHRDTYIALHQTDRGIIRFERSLSGPGRLLGPSHYSPFPAAARDHVWLCDPQGRHHDKPHVAWEIDGEGKLIRELHLPRGVFLRGELGQRFVVQIGSELFLWSGRGQVGGHPVASGWFVGIFSDTLIWVEVDTRATLRWAGTFHGAITPTGVDFWTYVHPSPAPTGSTIAIPFDSAVKGRGGLAIVDLVNGTSVMAEGAFKYSSYPPVWSRDGDAIFLGLPFERRIARVDTKSLAMERLGIKRAPMPILAV